MRWSPIHIWALSRLLRPGRPDRSEADRKGRGPPLVSSWLYLAAVYVSHGGPPPRDTIWPEEALESHHCIDFSEAKSAGRLPLHAQIYTNEEDVGTAVLDLLVHHFMDVTAAPVAAEKVNGNKGPHVQKGCFTCKAFHLKASISWVNP